MATVVGDLLSSLTVPIHSILLATVVGSLFLYWFIMGQDELDDAMADVSLPELMDRLRDHVAAVNNGGNGIGQRHNAANVIPVPRNAVNNPANLVNNNHNNPQAPPPPPPQWNWDWMLLRLRTHPEEAAAYCHTVDPPPLLQVLQLGGHPIPPRVVHAFLEAYEDVALHSDQYGTTPLLAAVQRIQYVPVVSATNVAQDEHQQQEQQQQDQCEIVQALLQANSYAAQQPNSQGQLPLHLVRTNSKLVKRLLDVFPEGVDASDHQGRLPLHYFCRQYESSEDDDDDDGNGNNANDAQQPQQQQDENDNGNDQAPQLPQQQEIARDADNHNNEDDEEEEGHEEPPPRPKRLILPDPEVAKLLLQSSSSNSSSLALCQDNNGITPLHILYQELKDVLLQLKESDSNHATLDTLWVILTILVQSASAAVSTPITPLKGNANFQMVHALVALQCPATVMTEALRRYPEQAIQRDAHGRTPLLLAVEILGQHAQDITPSTTTTNKPDEMAAVVCALIKCNPAAARMTDQEGRLAIDLLSEIGYYDSDLFEAMVMAEPRAIDTRDLKNKQHPFLTAALASNRNQVAASVYHLLRAKPHVIQFFMDDNKHK